MLVYAIGDIHGCFDQLVSLLSLIDQHAAGQPHKIITLGDYVDRGPRSKDVLDLLMQRTDIVKLMGNHEQMMLSAFWQSDPHSVQDFLVNGGHETLQSFGAPTPQHIPSSYIRFIVDLPLSADDGRRFYVHAGIDPGLPLSGQRDSTMLWVRQPFLSCGFPFEKYVVHGHTPQAGLIDIRHNRTNVDAGCCFTGVLGAAVFDDTQDKPIGLLYARS